MSGLGSPQEVVERALDTSRADGCVVIVEELSQIELRFANNTTTTNGQRRQRRVTIASFAAGTRSTGVSGADGGPPMSMGVASASGAVDVEDLVRRSEAEAARPVPADDASALVAPSESHGRFDDPPPSTTFSVLDPIVEGLVEAFGRARSSHRTLAGFATHGVTSVYLGTTSGVRACHSEPAGTMELVARSSDGTRSAWTGAGSSDFQDVHLGVLEERLDRSLGWASRQCELPAGRYEVLLPPDATADLMVALSEAMSGRDAEEGRSPFSAAGGGTRLGERICPLPFELRGGPDEPGLESAPFLVATASGADVSVFDNGLPLGATRWIDDGVLQRLRYHRAGARRWGRPATPPTGNLVLSLPGAGSSLDDMVASTKRGLLLTCLWYIREVDPTTLLLTGLTRDGVYLVEDGEVVGAVNNFRFNESPIDVLAKTQEAGRTERALSREWGEWMSRTAMPPLRVAEFNMSSVSPAT